MSADPRGHASAASAGGSSSSSSSANLTSAAGAAAARSRSGPPPLSLEALIADWRRVRAHSLALAAPLSAEDQGLQSMPDASPTKWHLGHTSWFFETLLLQPALPDYRVFDPAFGYLFNSYYEALGARHARPRRGLLSRPDLAQVMAYRAHVDAAMERLFGEPGLRARADWLATLQLGLHHEQQHQELILTDILHAFSLNPLYPAYAPRSAPPAAPAVELHWLAQPGGIREIGHAGAGFAFDNETPRHAVLLQPYALANRLVNCAEYLEFIADGGYRRPELWLSDGWAQVQQQGWQAPLYWVAPDQPCLSDRQAATMASGPASVAAASATRPASAAGGDARTGGWRVFGLHGLEPLQPEQAVTQLSFYEAAAYAEWRGVRLPTEFEWEAAVADPGLRQIADTAWQWTRSSYDPYPGFRPFAGPAAEYNGKFMVGQLVLRGGSLATPAGHARSSYRNFFPPSARWQFSGIRLARDL